MDDGEDLTLTIPAIRAAYEAGAEPGEVVARVFERIAAVADPGIFIHLDRDAALWAAAALGSYDAKRPLWGIPFAVKDNIDVAGMPTTAGCPAYAYLPAADAFVVARLRAAGAIPVGKTNLDQFAAGLVGLRTPYPAPRNAVDPAIVPGGSSSGSAVVVAHGIVPFALGTDTAGSGRVPAALNNIVGLKPTLGALSSSGVVPACRTLDTVSVLALTVADAYAVFAVAAGYDPADPWSVAQVVPELSAAPPFLTVGVPDERSAKFFGDKVQAKAFAASGATLAGFGMGIRPLDFTPFYDVAALLYDGPWIAERHAAIATFMARREAAMLPLTAAIIAEAGRYSATDAFVGQYRLAELRRSLEGLFRSVDLLCVPSVPSLTTVASVAANPIEENARLGTYTNFVNLMNLCAIAVPTGPRGDGRPGGVTLIAKAGRDALLAAVATRLEQGSGEHRRGAPRALGATRVPLEPLAAPPDRGGPDELELAVCGAHMSGLPLNDELVSRGGRFLRAVTTTPDYHLFALPGGPPRRPGLVRAQPDAGTSGGAVATEVWALPLAAVGGFLAGIPAPLGIGTVQLADGTAPKGFLCEAGATAAAEDVTRFGGWRAALAGLADMAGSGGHVALASTNPDGNTAADRG